MQMSSGLGNKQSRFGPEVVVASSHVKRTAKRVLQYEYYVDI